MVLDGVILATPKMNTYFKNYSINEVKIRNSLLQLLLSLSQNLSWCVDMDRRRSQVPRGIRRGYAAPRLLGFYVRIPSGIWMFVSFGCCVLSGRWPCVGLITRPEESYRVCVCVCVCVVCDGEALQREAMIRNGVAAPQEKKYEYEVTKTVHYGRSS